MYTDTRVTPAASWRYALALALLAQQLAQRSI
jgi:hypothetical protein